MLDTAAESKSLKSMLENLTPVADEGNRAYICATVLNLYVECNRRIHNRNLLTPGDFIAVMKIIDILFGPLKEPSLSEQNPGKLTAEQEKGLLEVLEKQI